ncbi:MAG: diguanylate cyclase [Betaproteobacteria bacterium]|nr:diguanylate cyclase [Betaproteobacteria bacterium]
MNALEVFRKALRELSDRHAQELPRKLAEIEELWNIVLHAGGARDGLVQVQRLAHGLDVASSMLGLPELSSPARRLSHVLSTGLASGGGLESVDAARVEELLQNLRAAASALGPQMEGPTPAEPTPLPPAPEAAPVLRVVQESSPSPPLDHDPENPPPATAGNAHDPEPVAASDTHDPRKHAPTERLDHERRVLYLLEADAETAENLASQLGRFGYDTHLVDSSSALIEALSRQQPYAILVDVDLAGGGYQVAQSIAALGSSAISRVPLLFLSSHPDVQARLDSVRAGAVAYFLKPVRVGELVDKLDALASRETPEPYRVMIVDADINRADLCRAILHEVGMEVAIVRDPSDLVASLGDFNPELLLIALKLPDCGGDEVAQVVHQIPSYVSLPVVFLSEHWNLDRQIGLMNVGGDALLPLPLQASQLIATVIARVERYRTLSALMQQDSLTGLLNHSRLQQYLEIEALRAIRQSHPLAFAMIDIDHFKTVNDQFGHPVGDRILKDLARFLRQQLRKSDIVGRYGGEEFAVILTDTDGPSALAVVAKLCADFSRLEHEVDDTSLTVTFSAGVAAMNGRRSARDLVLAADRALYAAKRAGRNRVVLAAE